MCEVSGKLIAWMDGELAESEASVVERHVRDCSECRSRVDRFGEVSRLVVNYCDVRVGAGLRRKLPGWVLAVAGAVATAALLLLTFRPATVKSIPVVAWAVNPAPIAVPKTVLVPAPIKTKAKAVLRHTESVTRRNSDDDWVPADPDVQIVIPAEAMFAPGAVPEGTIFRADLSMASDGSVQGLRLLQ